MRNWLLIKPQVELLDQWCRLADTFVHHRLHHHQAPAPWVATAQHVSVRDHGPDGRYRDNYSDATLRQWARHMMKRHDERRAIYVYLDNDQIDSPTMRVHQHASGVKKEWSSLGRSKPGRAHDEDPRASMRKGVRPAF